MNNFVVDKYVPDQVMMTLCAIAYTSFDSISILQDKLNEAEGLEQTYEAIWWAKDDVNLVYVVKNSATKDYTIAIRGTIFALGIAFLFNWYEDLDIGHQASLPFCEFEKAKINVGILSAILEIDDLTYNGRPLNQMVNNFAKGSKVYITGHSLGGTLASAYAAKLACSNLVDLDIIPYTFAAPTAGNRAFADLFHPNSTHCLFSQSISCFNSRDIIPYAWHDLKGLPAVDYGKLICPPDFMLCLDNLARLLILANVKYVQPALQRRIQGSLGSKNKYFEEATHQHQHNTYMKVLGLNPINSSNFYFKQKKQEILSTSLYEFIDR